jgi:hypothetical protein
VVVRLRRRCGRGGPQLRLCLVELAPLQMGAAKGQELERPSGCAREPAEGSGRSFRQS